jgi:hypothetical protein
MKNGRTKSSISDMNQISSLKLPPRVLVDSRKTVIQQRKSSNSSPKVEYDFFEEEDKSPRNKEGTNSRKTSPRMKEDYSKIFTEKTLQTFEEEVVVELLQEGFLTKEGSQWKTWKKRFFSLKSDGTFHYKEKFTVRPRIYFHSQKDKAPIKIMNISGVKLVCLPPEKKKPHCFRIDVEDGALYLCAVNDDDFEAWKKSKIKKLIIGFIQAGCITNEIQGYDENDKVTIYKSIEISKQKIILPQQLKIKKKIGEGSQGTVHLVELDNIPNVQLSIKVYPKKLITGFNDLTQCINEIETLELGIVILTI